MHISSVPCTLFEISVCLSRGQLSGAAMIGWVKSEIFFTNWSTPLSVYNFSLLECEAIIAQYPWHYIRCIVLLKKNFRLICNVTRLIQSHISSHVKRSTPTSGNVSRHGERKPLSELLCSLEVTRQWHISTPTMVCGVSLFLRFHCISRKCHRFNRVSQNVSSIQTPSKLLLRSLAMTDMGVGMIAEPLAKVALVSSFEGIISNIHVYTSYVRFSSSYTLCMVSLLTSTSINVDRLLAFSLGIRYWQVVPSMRVHLT